MLASEVGHAPAVRVSRAPGRWSDAAVRSAQQCSNAGQILEVF